MTEKLYEITTVTGVEEDYIEGEYKDREFVVDDKGNVTIGGELKGQKPDGEATQVETEEEYPTEAEIKVTATAKEGTISSIEPINGATLKTGEAGTDNVEMIFQVEKNGNYRFKITGSNNRIRIVSCKVENLVILARDLFTAIEETHTTEIKEVLVKGRTSSNGAEDPEIYSLNVIRYAGNLTLDGNTQVEGAKLEDNVYEFGSENDVSGIKVVNGNSTVEYAQNTVVLKVEGNLTINENVTLTAVKSNDGYGGPKGLIIYCTGTLTNNGTINMTARGAYAEGQNVYLFKNANTSNLYEFIPEYGNYGGSGNFTKKNSILVGNPGLNGEGRGTAGGGSGCSYHSATTGGATSGSGTRGTSYSGGPGGGACWSNSNGNAQYAGPGQDPGGPGGYRHYTYNDTSDGAGNPSNGTGGLLVIYSTNLYNNANILSKGSSSNEATCRGGGSGGGSINIFYLQKYENKGTINADGVDCGNGGAGGNGTITIGSIATGTFEIQ